MDYYGIALDIARTTRAQLAEQRLFYADGVEERAAKVAAAVAIVERERIAQARVAGADAGPTPAFLQSIVDEFERSAL